MKDIVKINLLTEREVGTDTLPIGNISASELTVRLDNSNRDFDAGNTQSPIYQGVKANRRIRTWVGTGTDNTWDDFSAETLEAKVAMTWEEFGMTKEYIPLGVHWSGDWDVP